MVRLAKMEELDEILEIYAAARRFMRASGNLTQWAGGYPGAEVVRQDIASEQLYVIDEDGIWACFALIGGGDPTYAVIDGAWGDSSDYGTIHRVAGNGRGRGVVAKAMAFARQQYDHLRIDTHADNYPMQRALEKENFSHRGTIYLENGDPRMAYEWSLAPELEALVGEKLTRFFSPEGASYDVWRAGDRVLKKAKGREAEIYRTYLADREGTPRLEGVLCHRGTDYLLLEYVEGEDLCRCDRRKLTLALDALIGLQDRFWGADGEDFGKSLTRRENRGKYLNDAQLEAAYARFLERYRTVPRTLCHDDLLPFNVLVGAEKAVLIDWEVGGILPYPCSLARLIAHGDTTGADIFYMTDEDREFAIEYYYVNLVEKKGIGYDEYRATVADFLFYEYCEWIMLGNRYPNADMTRFRRYLEKAKAHLK